MLGELKRYKHVIGLTLLVVALVAGFIRFNGDRERFFAMVLGQIWFGQAVYNYLRDGWVTIGPGGMGPEDDPMHRAVLAGVAMFLYMLVFFLF
ncbi:MULTISPECIES: hypothetical protein [Pseudomonas]|jgi:hypothetical protein|uniref:hypothetical protein n=1 Tax=Pseudomonas TaxID=286 RepID=UPI0008770199|nr:MULTISPECIES: hypothetical protein [Pseudomonas]MBP3999952.1 hypothetical protein [Pseudomonas koreensis]POA32898.1 hypothetical protein C1891_22550 [Pseudomonas sp. GW456-12-1-14-TSB6]QIA03923.1 hypothetical protein GZH78_17810 [Pseudomonas fluorescens]TFA85048.1 hypothetical protein F638_2675 [Pseudomonas sp. LAIL14HWK12:I2]SCZ31648.1 hypothetical protein SAMN03159313_3345 [Pseudomonas sp. NFIX46]